MERSTKKTNIKDLPPDLVREIGEYTNRDLPAYSSLDKKIREITEKVYLENVCKQDITEKEFRNYLKTEPERFATQRKSGINIYNFYIDERNDVVYAPQSIDTSFNATEESDQFLDD